MFDRGFGFVACAADFIGFSGEVGSPPVGVSKRRLAMLMLRRPQAQRTNVFATLFDNRKYGIHIWRPMNFVISSVPSLVYAGLSATAGMSPDK
jgi:hypothetical protein